MTQDLKTRIESIYALDSRVRKLEASWCRESLSPAGYSELKDKQMSLRAKAPEMVDIIRSLEAKVAQLEERLND